MWGRGLGAPLDPPLAVIARMLLQLTMQHTDARCERLNGSLRGLQGLQLIHTEYIFFSGPANRYQLSDSVSRAPCYIYD